MPSTYEILILSKHPGFVLYNCGSFLKMVSPKMRVHTKCPLLGLTHLLLEDHSQECFEKL